MNLDYKENLFYGTDIQINDKIIIHQPTIAEIRNYNGGEKMSGEIGYFKMISIITATPADYDYDLYKEGIRYEDIDPMEFFFGLVHMYNFTPEITHPIFGDLDLTQFIMMTNDETGQKVFVNQDDIRIDKFLYSYMINIVREIHNIKENKTVWMNETSRKMHMDYEEKKRKRRQHRHEKPKSILLPMISMLINMPGFKYNREEVQSLNLYFFYDSYKQQLHSQQVDHLMTGVYVGLIDSKKMNLEESLNMLRQDV